MERRIDPRALHGQADGVQGLAETAARLLDGLDSASGGSFQVDAAIAATNSALRASAEKIGSGLAEYGTRMHESATSFEHTEQSNTEASEAFFRQLGDQA